VFSLYCQVILISVIFTKITQKFVLKKLTRYENSSRSLLCSVVVLHIAKLGGAAELCKLYWDL